jgi:toxic protein SymE
MTKTKNIKVQYSSRYTGSRYRRDYQNYPKIQMEGRWLEELGFHIGDSLQVEYEAGAIHITLSPQPSLKI